ncbi:MAG: hypothetical protein AAF531_23900 [Actinomycetota bacterium]
MSRDAEGRANLGGCLDVPDFVELVFYGGIAVLVLVLGWYVSLRTLISSFGAPGGAALVAWTLVTAFIVGRDVQRRSWSPVSIAVAGVYLLSLAVVVATTLAPAGS